MYLLIYIYIFFFSIAQQPLVGQDLLDIEAPWSYSDTPDSVGILWTSDQPEAETSTWQHTTFTWDRHTCPPPRGFEHTIPARERPQTHALDRVATGIGTHLLVTKYISKLGEIRTPCNINTCTWSVRKVSDLWPGKRNWLTWSVRHLITLKVVPLGLHTLLPAVPPLLEACRKSLFRNGV